MGHVTALDQSEFILSTLFYTTTNERHLCELASTWQFWWYRSTASIFASIAQMGDRIPLYSRCLYSSQTVANTLSTSMNDCKENCLSISNRSGRPVEPVDLQRQIRYLLNCIDVFTKPAWSIAVRMKTGREVSDVFERIPSTCVTWCTATRVRKSNFLTQRSSPRYVVTA